MLQTEECSYGGSSCTFTQDIQSKECKTYVHDSNGEILSEFTDKDSDNDGIFDSEELITWTRTYDNSGNILSTTKETDKDFDGIIDAVVDQEWTWNPQGLNLSHSQYRDSDNDGVYDYSQETHWDYDGFGNKTLENHTVDVDGDGNIEEGSQSTWSYLYNSQQQIITKSHTYDEDFDGSVDLESTDYWSYDSNGILISHLSELIQSNHHTEMYIQWDNSSGNPIIENQYSEVNGLRYLDYARTSCVP